MVLLVKLDTNCAVLDISVLHDCEDSTWWTREQRRGFLYQTSEQFLFNVVLFLVCSEYELFNNRYYHIGRYALLSSTMSVSLAL